nr:adult-specific rigid cuticular protein 15.5-like [Dermacentor andersoni]
MFPTVQLLFTLFVVEGYALHHHQQPAQPGYGGPGFGGYATPAATQYRGYDSYASPPQPYCFGYDNVDEYGNRQFRSEQGDVNNVKTGSYGYRDVNGLYRRVNYVADAYGFRTTVDTNEPGTAPGASANAVFNAAPFVPPSGAVHSGTASAYTTRPAVPYNAGTFGGYAGYGHNPYVGDAGVYGNALHGRQGYGTSAPAFGGYAYGDQSSYGYGAVGSGTGYAPGADEVPAGYNSWPSAHHGSRRR